MDWSEKHLSLSNGLKELNSNVIYKYNTGNMEIIIISFLEKMIELETFFNNKIFTKRVQERLHFLAYFFIIASMAYQFLNYKTNSFVFIVMATSLFFMRVPLLAHRKRPFLLFSSMLTTFATYTLIYFSCGTSVKNNDPTTIRFVFGGLFSVMSWMPHPQDPCKIRYSFTDVFIFPLCYFMGGKRQQPELSEITAVLVFLVSTMHFLTFFWLLTLPFSFITVPDIIHTIGVVSVLCSIVFGEILYAQKQTRLRIDPTRDNQEYDTIPYEEQVEGKSFVQIVTSSAFKITLQNTGNQTWYSKSHFLTRKTSKDSKRNSFPWSRYLPSFELKPMQTVVLVPETYAFEGKCKRVKGVHCFSVKDISEQVETCLCAPSTDGCETIAKRIDFYKKLNEDSTVSHECFSLLGLLKKILSIISCMYDAYNVESKIVLFLEKVIECETFFFENIYTKRFQKVLISLPVYFTLASLTYLYLTNQMNNPIYRRIIIGFICTFPFFVIHRKRPFLLFSCVLTAFATLTLVNANLKPGREEFCAGIAVLFTVVNICPQPIDLCEIRYHFTDSYVFHDRLDKNGDRQFTTCLPPCFAVAFVTMFAMLYLGVVTLALLFSAFTITTPEIMAVIGAVLIVSSLVFGEIAHAQKQTRLRFDPTRDNHKYSTVPHNREDEGEEIIRILSSTAFEITLQNVSDEDWHSYGHFFTRTTESSAVKRGLNHLWLSACKLPSFALKPMETVVLVPETYEYDGPCERVRALCFGTKDLSERVETCLYSGYPGSSEKTETNVLFYKKLDKVKKNKDKVFAI